MIKNYTSKNINSRYFAKENALTTSTVDTSFFTSVKKESNPISWIPTLILLFTFLLSTNIYAQFPGNDNTAGAGKTFNVPAGVTSITAQIWGSGGSGGGSSANNNSGSGAGGGGYTTKTFTVTTGSLITYTVGAGAAAAGTGSNGNAGNASSLTHAPSATNLSGNGGARGNANSGTGGTGGTSSGGSTNTSGSNGSGGGTNTGGDGGNGGNAAGTGGNGQNNANGSPGTIPGGGGGGGEFGGGTSKAGGAGANGQVTLTFIAVTSIAPNPICRGNQITITGSNFSAGATTVSIGGTACTSVTVVSATSITAVVGLATPTGSQVVTITNPNGTNNGISITINNALAAIGGGTATACTGSPTPAFTDATGGGTWSIINGTGTASITAGGVVTGLTAGTVTVVYTLGNCSVNAALTVNAIPTIATTPSPASAATGVCYAGAGAISSTSWTAVAGATSYDVYFGAGSLPGAVTLNVATNAYTTGTLLANTTYYWKVEAKNSCGTAVGSSTWTFTTAASPCGYCAAGGSNQAAGMISSVDFSSINRSSAFDGYINTGLTTNVVKTLSYNLTIKRYDNSTYNLYTEAWIDWNADGDFADAGEIVAPSLASNTIGEITRIVSVTVPAGATSGVTRMRVMMKYNAAPTATGCDTSTIYMDVEDYYVNIINNVACTAPTAQPTALVLTPISGGFTGTFTAASPAPDSYIIVANTTGVTPTPTNGTTYAVGSTMGAGNLVVASVNGPSFTTSGLSGSTFYNIYIYSFNGLCTSGPLYLAPSPLTGTGTTLAESYCSPTVSTGFATNNYIKTVNFIGNIVNTNNSSTNNNVAPVGYQDFTGLGSRATQAQGEGINIFLDTNQAAAVFMKAWVDWNKDGVFSDTNEIVYQCSNAFLNTTYGFQVPANTTPGDYRIRMRINKSNYPSDNFYTACGNLANYGETEDYLFTVIQSCPAKITSITPGFNCGTGTVNLAATGTAGTTEYRWYTLPSGGSYTASPTSSWTTPSISATTTYYVTAYNGACESLFRTAVVATIKPVSTLTFSNSTPTVCGENSIIDLSASGTNEQVYLIDENFESGLGVFTGVAYGTQTSALTNWGVKTSTYVPVYPTYPVWYPAISSGFGTNNFALTTSDIVAGGGTFGKIDNAIESATVNTIGFLNLTLTFNMYFSSYYDSNNAATEFVVAEYKNGAGAWTLIPGGQFLADEGIGTQFVFKTLNMDAFAGITNLKVRIRYKAGWCDGVAIDDVKLFGDKPLVPNITWTSALPVDAYTDAACTIPYVAGTPVSTVWVKPTLAQLEQGTYSFTANANLTNGCSISGTINVTNQSKVWKGTTDNDWNKPSNWLPATIPTATDCVIIPTGTNSKIMNTPNALAKNLTVKAPTGNLELQSGKNLTVTDWINVEAGATFNVRNSANLVQVNNAPVPANTGNINMERIANIFLQDYVYWSSPVGNLTAGTFPVTSVSPSTPGGYIYKWGTTTVNPNGGQGYWVGTNENMIPGTGYIVRGPNGFNNTTKTNLTANFIGVPNNGTFTPTISRGTDFTTPGTQGIPRTATDDNWNLLGNPYPSSIGINEFLTANAANLSGGVRLWTHGNLPTNATDPFYQNFATNYYASDYIAVNLTGATSGPGDVKIASGQGFMVLMNAGAAGSNTVTFNNTMRSAAFANNVFYKNEASVNQNVAEEKHRIWLDLVGPTGNTTRTLVGYIPGATQANDDLYDSFTDYKNPQNFYSLINNEIMQIQGRALPFDNADVIPMGFKASQSGSHSIAIAAVDGILADPSQNIYLEDKLLNTIHDLKAAPYSFTTAAGIVNNRFVLRYTNTTLSTTEFDYTNSVKIFASNRINVKSSNQAIKEVSVFDILGKTIFNKKNVNATELLINELSPTSNVLIVKVILENNVEVIKKVVF